MVVVWRSGSFRDEQESNCFRPSWFVGIAFAPFIQAGCLIGKKPNHNSCRPLRHDVSLVTFSFPETLYGDVGYTATVDFRGPTNLVTGIGRTAEAGAKTS